MHHDKIFIYDLKIPTIIGCLDREKTIIQTLIFDIELHTTFNTLIQKDDIQNTINYAQVVEIVTHYVQQSRFNLIETLAENLAQKLLSEFKPKQVIIKITKPEAILNIPNVGVCIVR